MESARFSWCQLENCFSAKPIMPVFVRELWLPSPKTLGCGGFTMNKNESLFSPHSPLPLNDQDKNRVPMKLIQFVPQCPSHYFHSRSCMHAAWYEWTSRTFNLPSHLDETKSSRKLQHYQLINFIPWFAWHVLMVAWQLWLGCTKVCMLKNKWAFYFGCSCVLNKSLTE